MVMILRTESLISFRALYSVVVLPLPVGPVTRRSRAAWPAPPETSRVPLGHAQVASRIRFASCRNNRITTASPWIIGMIEMRTSTSLPLTRILIRPSCGSRFSAMFRRSES
jgi:hypothetical protein